MTHYYFYEYIYIYCLAAVSYSFFPVYINKVRLMLHAKWDKGPIAAQTAALAMVARLTTNEEKLFTLFLY